MFFFANGVLFYNKHEYVYYWSELSMLFWITIKTNMHPNSVNISSKSIVIKVFKHVLLLGIILRSILIIDLMGLTFWDGLMPQNSQKYVNK